MRSHEGDLDSALVANPSPDLKTLIQNKNEILSKREIYHIVKNKCFYNIDMSGIDFSGFDLKNIGFAGSNLSGSCFFDANLNGANFSFANLKDVNFIDAKLVGARFESANLSGAIFSNKSLEVAIISGACLKGIDLRRLVPDFKRINFNNMSFQDVHVSSDYFSSRSNDLSYSVESNFNADLQGVNLEGQRLSGLNLSFLDLSYANLSNANMYRTNLFATKLSRSNINDAIRGGASLEGVNLSGVDISGLSFVGLSLKSADLRGCNLKGVNFTRTELVGVAFSSCNVMDAIQACACLVGSFLKYVDFTNCDLSGLNFIGANLQSANFTGANLNFTEFTGASLQHAVFTDASLEGANFSGTIRDENSFFYRRSSSLMLNEGAEKKQEMSRAALIMSDIKVEIPELEEQTALTFQMKGFELYSSEKTPKSVVRAIVFYIKAIRIDKDYTLAYFRLNEALERLSLFQYAHIDFIKLNKKAIILFNTLILSKNDTNAASSLESSELSSKEIEKMILDAKNRIQQLTIRLSGRKPYSNLSSIQEEVGNTVLWRGVLDLYFPILDQYTPKSLDIINEKIHGVACHISAELNSNLEVSLSADRKDPDDCFKLGLGMVMSGYFPEWGVSDSSNQSIFIALLFIHKAIYLGHGKSDAILWKKRGLLLDMIYPPSSLGIREAKQCFQRANHITQASALSLKLQELIMHIIQTYRLDASLLSALFDTVSILTRKLQDVFSEILETLLSQRNALKEVVASSITRFLVAVEDFMTNTLGGTMSTVLERCLSEALLREFDSFVEREKQFYSPVVTQHEESILVDNKKSEKLAEDEGYCLI